MAKKKSIIINDAEISLIIKDKEDYISLTDMAKFKNAQATGLVISHWMSTRYAIEYMGIWEGLYNADFNVREFRKNKNESGGNGFV